MVLNNIYYLNCIPIYIDSLIRITQEPETTEVELNNINSLIKKADLYAAILPVTASNTFLPLSMKKIIRWNLRFQEISKIFFQKES